MAKVTNFQFGKHAPKKVLTWPLKKFQKGSMARVTWRDNSNVQTAAIGPIPRSKERILVKRKFESTCRPVLMSKRHYYLWYFTGRHWTDSVFVWTCILLSLLLGLKLYCEWMCARQLRQMTVPYLCIHGTCSSVEEWQNTSYPGSSVSLSEACFIVNLRHKNDLIWRR